MKHSTFLSSRSTAGTVSYLKTLPIATYLFFNPLTCMAVHNVTCLIEVMLYTRMYNIQMYTLAILFKTVLEAWNFLLYHLVYALSSKLSLWGTQCLSSGLGLFCAQLHML